MMKKQSFLSNLIGEHSYEACSEWAKFIVWIGGIILMVLFVLSLFFHSGIINYLLQLTTGTSLLFIAYVFICIILFDIQVKVEDPEQKWWEKKKEMPKPFKYKLTIVWTVLLLVLGVLTIYYSNKYRNRYDFECSKFLVDHKAHVFHLVWYDECEDAVKAEKLEEMYGYEIDNTYSFCECCNECEEEAEP